MRMYSLDPDIDMRADLSACRDALRDGSRTFLMASLVLPRGVRDAACALYAFCRLADDEIDLNGGAAEALSRLRERLDRIYEHRPFPIAADRAFAEVVCRFAIPRTLPDALLEGFAWDAQGRRYETLSDLRAYAVRVAGTVGAMMAMLMGQRSPDVVGRACELGVAMQFTNIARDVGEDARIGRLYLPLQWLREAGIDPDAFVRRPVFTDGLGSVVQRLLQEADLHYAGSSAGIAQLPAMCRPGIEAARILYAEIGREVLRTGGNSVARRAVVSPLRKTFLMAKVATTWMAPQRTAAAAALPEQTFLLEAVAATPTAPLRRRAPDRPPWWDVQRRLVWLIELFERLERRAQSERI
jgi:15-cis-phytoene synthase